MDWKVPSWNLPTDQVNRVFLVTLRGRAMNPQEIRVDVFLSDGLERVQISDSETLDVVRRFRDLEPGEPFRCHEPVWGLVFCNMDKPLFAAALSYECNNAYVYTNQGRELRAFNASGPNALALRNILLRISAKVTDPGQAAHSP